MLPGIIRAAKARIAQALSVPPEEAAVEESALLYVRRRHEADRKARGYHLTLDTWPPEPQIRRARRRWDAQDTHADS